MRAFVRCLQQLTHHATPHHATQRIARHREVLDRYTEITPHVQLAGPTSFAPIIYEAISIVRQSKEYHILVIVADGQVTR